MECIDFETMSSIGFKIFTAIISILSFGLGVMALTTWKKQIKYKVVYDNALQFEASMTLFSMHTSGGADVSGCKYLQCFSDDMLPSYWLLLQRGFMVQETKDLYQAYSNCMKHWRETGEPKVPSDLHKELLTSLNTFSIKLREVF